VPQRLGQLINLNIARFQRLVPERRQVLVSHAQTQGRAGAQDRFGILLVERDGAGLEKLPVKHREQAAHAVILRAEQLVAPRRAHVLVHLDVLERHGQTVLQRIRHRLHHIEKRCHHRQAQFDLNSFHPAR
jgi:hypothetical protein